MREGLSLQIKNDLVEIERLTQEVGSWCREQALSGVVEFQIDLVLDELVSNVIHHGLKDSKEHFIEVSLHRDGHDLVVEVEDDGVGPPGGGRATTILPWTRRRWQRALS